MSVAAYMLINCEGKEDAVVQRLNSYDSNVIKAIKVHGVYDVVAEVYGKSLRELDSLKRKISNENNLSSILTLIPTPEKKNLAHPM